MRRAGFSADDLLRLRQRRVGSTLLAFLQSTYEAAAELGGWERAALDEESETNRGRLAAPGEGASGRSRRSGWVLPDLDAAGRVEPGPRLYSAGKKDDADDIPSGIPS